MTRARHTHVSLESTPYYHCVCRCVRRAFLCGRDAYSGQDYEHRRQWVVERLASLVDAFAIELCAYAVMSNHYHVVIKINRDQAASWSDEEVAERWMRFFKGPSLVALWLDGQSNAAEAMRAREIIATWRARLFDLGWFMKCLNEHLARRANQEDACKGRFWESRYRCQALLDERAVLSCMAYVDLNPVRACMAHTPEESDYTSVKQRVCTLKRKTDSAEMPELIALAGASSPGNGPDTSVCGIQLLDYLELVDDTGRAVLQGKRGTITEEAAGILARLGIDHRAWLTHMKPGQHRQPVATGSMSCLMRYARSTGRCWIAGWRAAAALS
ncbi:transposase [Alloalcanivorax mobilis]|uniref:transposase n=1 Tax=Alloalcanivorax mobilis TaxID=2019569 RepID=UPI000C780BB9|nr:transposase [Alloalcanivorax mobilis]